MTFVWSYAGFKHTGGFELLFVDYGIKGAVSLYLIQNWMIGVFFTAHGTLSISLLTHNSNLLSSFSLALCQCCTAFTAMFSIHWEDLCFNYHNHKNALMLCGPNLLLFLPKIILFCNISSTFCFFIFLSPRK